MYRYKYSISKSADREIFNKYYSILSEKFPGLIRKKNNENNMEQAFFLSPEGETEKLCLVLDSFEDCIELFSEDKLDFLMGFRRKKLTEETKGSYVYNLMGFRRERLTEETKGSYVYNNPSPGQILPVEFGFFILNLIMGALNSGSFSLGFMSGGLDGLFDDPIKYFLYSLPFALVYFFSYRSIKRDMGFSPFRIRFIQLGGIVTIAACLISILLILIRIPFGLIVLLLLMCSVHLIIYGMVTSIILEFIVRFVMGNNE